MLALCLVAGACASSPRPESSPANAPAAAAAAATIQHLVPPDNSSGAAPTRFEWTPVAGADRYVISVFNEIDMEVWEQDDMREPRVSWPAELRVETGTYFWAVAALKDGRPIARSGRAAFVVLR